MENAEPFTETLKYAPSRIYQSQPVGWYRRHPVHFVAARHLVVRTSLIQVVPTCPLVPCTMCLPGTGQNITGSAWKFAVARFAAGRSVCKTVGSLEATPAITHGDFLSNSCAFAIHHASTWAGGVVH